MRRGDTGKSSSNWPPGDNRSARATEYIRAAEKHLQGKHYSRALESLRYAQNCEPGNKYILAIIERVLTLSKTEPSAPQPEVSSDANRYLSVTVSPSFESGFKPPETQAVESIPHDLVREFTSIARGYMKIGLPEAAFDALMKAYLLDPIDPDVISCEREVIPVWNRARAAAATPLPPDGIDRDFTSNTVHASPAEDPADALAIGPELPTPLSSEPPAPVTAIPITIGQETSEAPAPAQDPAEGNGAVQDDPWGSTRSKRQEMTPEQTAQRLELLVQQKESERQEWEREIYRAASRLPRLLDDTQKDDPGFHLDRPSRTARAARGFLRRLKRK